MSCECDSGKFGCGCCCASVTGLRGGLPPDVIKTVSYDLSLDVQVTQDRHHIARLLLNKPVHIVNVEFALVSLNRDFTAGSEAKQVIEPAAADLAMASLLPVNVSLFTMPSYAGLVSLLGGGFCPSEDAGQNRKYFTTGTLNAYNPNWQSHAELFGYFADGGLFVEINVPDPNHGVRVTVNYVDRVQFAPAYHDPVGVLQHYWKCSHGPESEFLSGFYAGTSITGEQDSASVASVGPGSSHLSVNSDAAQHVSNSQVAVAVENTDPFAPAPLSSWGTDIWY
jgi:hypothetical protein